MSSHNIVLDKDVLITQLKGTVYLVTADGSQIPLAEGDVLPRDAVLLAPEGASFQGGDTPFTLSPTKDPMADDAPLLARNVPTGTPDDIAALQQAILEGADPTKTFEASAAGGAPATGNVGGVAGASGNGGFVTIDRTGGATLSTAGFDSANPDDPAVLVDAQDDEDTLLDLTAPAITVSAPDNTNDSTPTITGTTNAAPGSTVTLVVTDVNGNQQTLTATVQPDGTYSSDVISPLPDGGYDVTASVTDPAGNTGTATDGGRVDTTAPSVTVNAPDNTNDSTPTITGTTNAAPGSTLTLVVTDVNGNQQTLTATVQPDGTYSSDVISPLPDGGYDVTASVTDPAGNTGTADDDGRVFVNDTVDAVNDSYEVNEDGSVVLTLLTNDQAPDGGLAIVSINGVALTGGAQSIAVSNGTVQIAVGGSISFVPSQDFNGDIHFDYVVKDADGDTDGATLNIRVTPVDDAFEDADEAVTLTEDSGTYRGTLLSGTNSVDGAVTVQSFSVGGSSYSFDASHGSFTVALAAGTLIINQSGDYSFTPVANWNGAVPEVSYSLTDSSSDSSTLNISVTPVDDAFGDDNETVSVAEDGVLSGSVLTGTSSVDGAVTVTGFSIGGITYAVGSSATLAGVGTLVSHANGVYTFTPVANWNGAVPEVSYTLTDGSSTDSSTLNIRVTPVDDAFEDADEAVTLAEDSGTYRGSVLTGTSSVDGPVTITGFSIGGTAYAVGSSATLAGVGTLVIQANGDYSFTPVANWNGAVPEVSYSLTDGSSTDSSTLNISVTPADDAFEDADEAVTLAEDSGTYRGTLLSGTSSVDGPVTITGFSIGGTAYAVGSSATLAGVGTLVIHANGDYTFTPVANWNGTVPEVSYTLTDGSSTDSSTLNISVTPAADAFEDADEAVTLAEDSGTHTGTLLSGTNSVDGPVTVQSFSVGGSSYSFDASHGSFTVALAAGTLMINQSGGYNFTPAANWSGDVPVISYVLTDGSSTNESTLSIRVTPVADAVPGSDSSVVIGAPLINTISFISDGGLTGKSTYTYGNGVTISTGGNGTFNWSGGNNLGVNSAGDNGTEAQRIEGNEAINFSFPTGMQHIELKLKNSSDDVIKVSSKLEATDLVGQTTLSGSIATSATTIVSSANLKVELQLEVLNANGVTSTVTRIGMVNSGGSWSVSLGGISGTITKATLNATFDGALFNQGGNDSANVTYSVSADMSSLDIGLGAANAFNTSGRQQNDKANNGFQIEYIAVDPNPSQLTSFTYPVDLYALIQDTVGTPETFTHLSLSDLPVGTALSVVRADGSYEEILANALGEFDLSQYTSVLATPTTIPGTDKIYLVTSTELPSGFTPTLTLEVSDGASTAKTIIGGSASSTLEGGTGNDILDGGAGNETLNGGTGNDILSGGLGNDILTGGTGSDIFVWQKGDTATGSVSKDYIVDFSRAEGDKLDLRDLLDHDGSKSQDSLKTLLSVFQDNEGVHLQVKESSGASVTQEIVLMNHSFDSLTGGTGTTANQVIDMMLSNHTLEIDK